MEKHTDIEVIGRRRLKPPPPIKTYYKRPLFLFGIISACACVGRRPVEE